MSDATLDPRALGWRYSINYGPEGEENWANLIAPDGTNVANIRTHHAKAIVAGLSASPQPALAVKGLTDTWLLTGGPDGQFSKVVFGLENLKREAIAAVLGDGEDASEEAQDMRDRLDTPGDWEGDHWSISWSFEDGYLNVQRITDLSSLSIAPATADGWRTEGAAADQIIGQIEERFPNWRSYRDLIDCIDCTLADLRGPAAPTATGGR